MLEGTWIPTPLTLGNHTAASFICVSVRYYLHFIDRDVGIQHITCICNLSTWETEAGGLTNKASLAYRANSRAASTNRKSMFQGKVLKLFVDRLERQTAQQLRICVALAEDLN